MLDLQGTQFNNLKASHALYDIKKNIYRNKTADWMPLGKVQHFQSSFSSWKKSAELRCSWNFSYC